jgi:DNA recombination protein RmuC
MEMISLTAGALCGAAFGALLGWFMCERRSRSALAAAQTARALAEQRAMTLDGEILRHEQASQKELELAGSRHQEQLTQLETARTRISEIERELAGTSAALAALTRERESQESEHAAQIGELKLKVRSLEELTEKLRSEKAGIAGELIAATENLKASHDNLAEQRKLLAEAEQTFTAAFAQVSQSALERAGVSFLEIAKAKFETLSAEAGGALEQRKEQIATLLKPLEETLASYQKRLADVENSRTAAYGELLKQIGGMSETQRMLSAQTTHLVSALKKSNVRGRWGEIALERLVELSGMTEHVDFMVQQSLRAEDGLLRPDMVVKLSGNRNVVIDAKAVMGAYLEACAAVEDGQRTMHLAAHAKNVRTRINDLASKAYWAQFQQAPEFTVLFVPGESFLYAACDQDSDLIQYALSQKVLLATPTTLLALLKTIEIGWRQEAISANAEGIRKLGVEIYDRLATLAEHLTKLGRALDGTVDQFNKVVGTVETRVLVSARKIGEMGARSDQPVGTVEAVEKRVREFSADLHPDRSPLLPD